MSSWEDTAEMNEVLETLTTSELLSPLQSTEAYKTNQLNIYVQFFERKLFILYTL